MRILQINTLDGHGGAAQVARDLHCVFLGAGHESFMAVAQMMLPGDGRTAEVGSLLTRNRSAYQRALLNTAGHLQKYSGRGFGAMRMSRVLTHLAFPKGPGDILLGPEEWDYPASWLVHEAAGGQPDIIHCHNLHGGYFDLRALPWLCRRFPVVVTMHDAWLLGGGCAHSLDCPRWKTGCGGCPLYRGREKEDRTASRWLRKKKIYSNSRLHVVTPSAWLMEKVECSILAGAVETARVIPNGVDLAVFHPADRDSIRARLGLPRDAVVMTFAAHFGVHNVYKNFRMIRRAMEILSGMTAGRDLILLALGGEDGQERVGNLRVVHMPYETDRKAVALYFQAADVYVHASHADTFPNAVIEALACGIPVVATGVGGIPEQIKGLELEGCSGLHTADDATGVIVMPDDHAAMANALKLLMEDDVLRKRLGDNAARDASARFGLERCAGDYVALYEDAQSGRRARGL